METYSLTWSADLLLNIKKELIAKISRFNQILAGDEPIGKGSFGYVYKTKHTSSGFFGACKVIALPKYFFNEMKANSLTDEGALLMNSLQKEVFKIIEK